MPPFRRGVPPNRNRPSPDPWGQKVIRMTSSTGHAEPGLAAEDTRQTRRPRICMPTSRAVAKMPYHCGLYEAQDVLAEIDDVDLILFEPGPGFPLRERWHRRLVFHDVSRQLVFVNPGLRKVRLTRNYDLFVAVCQSYRDLLHLSAIEGWGDHCERSICWIDEMWAAHLPRYKYWLHILKRFDHVFVDCKSSVEPLSNAIDRSCSWLPGAVDTIRFTPYPDPPMRVIDVYSIGRRFDGIHHVLLRAAERKRIFYVYDTFTPAQSPVYDLRQHREFLANMAKRSRFFVVAPGKANLPQETHGQVAIGHRFYEGTAAGSILIGQSPPCAEFKTLFPWSDVVIELQPDGSDALEILTTLGSDHARMAAISQNNARNALLHHDWVYRWKEVLRVAGITPSPKMAAREERLRYLASLIARSADAPTEARPHQHQVG